jgi:hypothetical protein
MLPRPAALAGFALACLAVSTATLGSAQPAPRQTFVPAWLQAYPNSLSLDNVLFGTGQACQLCHEDGNGGNGWNGYGWELKGHIDGGASITTALGLVEPADSDADPTGSSNIVEIDASAQPGWTPGPNNTIHYSNGSTSPNQAPPAGIPDLDPGFATAYCFGDGSGTPCPCANNSAPGDGEGCANSTGLGGRVDASGSDSASADDLVFDAQHLLPGQPALLFVGLNATGGGSGVTFGDGLRCAGGSVVRLGIEVPNAMGQASWGPGLGALGGWGSGDIRRFQCWYRNPGGPCGSNFNLSNGLEITFTL